ncbi:MAG: serine/threonine protein kinase, partial [Planctomycetes bacterium]|nr:serine/threonine protein kinase [Planctomycetota bacterium]
GFEITTKLGGGMFGLVYRARRMSIGKDYAIKFLQVDDGEVQKAVLAELEAVKWFAQIDHPNLVSIEDRGEVDGIPYLVMAFAGTETLRDKVVAGRVPTAAEKDELLRWFLQCCRGLAALHERSLVHFDIKPANVFLKGSVARLGDYGLSKLVTHSRGSLSMGRGTPYYMAPEMLQRRGDHRSDIYSLGVMLYELLCGQVPFQGDSEWEVLKKHESEAPAIPAHLTARETAIVQRCLQKDPAARFASVHDLIAAFGGAASGAPAGFAPLAATGRAVAPPVPVPVPPPLPTTMAASAAAAPSAVPPPLPEVGLPPPARPRRSRLAGGFVLLAGLFLFALVWLRSVDFEPAPEATAPRERASSGRGVTTRGSSNPVDTLLTSLQKSIRTAVQRQQRVSLRELDPDTFRVPRDFTLYKVQLKDLGKAPQWSAGMATRLERLGRPVVVAGIVMLHDLDFDDADDQARAVNLLQFLGQATGIDSLSVDVGGREAGETDVCRFLAVTDAWRRVAEQFARDDASFQTLLALRGKNPGSSK